jgi:hypothetical protein
MKINVTYVPATYVPNWLYMNQLNGMKTYGNHISVWDWKLVEEAK